MTERTAIATLAALREVILDDLLSTSAADLYREALEDGEDVVAIGAEVKLMMQNAMTIEQRLPWQGRSHIPPDTLAMTVGPKEMRAARTTWSRRKWAVFGYAAALIAVVAVGFAGVEMWRNSRVYETARAEHRTVELPDGSQVELGAESSIQLKYSGKERRIALRSSEAFFRVRSGVGTPFIVEAGPMLIRAVGTEFNVDRAGDDTIVAVSEGVVEIVRVSHARTENVASRSTEVSATPLQMRAGESASIEDTSVPNPSQITPVDPTTVGAWRKKVLQFNGEPLSRVIEIINRYARHRARIGDEQVGNLQVLTTVDLSDADEWVSTLPNDMDVRITREPDGTIVLWKKQ